MTLNGVIALIFTEFNSVGGWLCHSGWRETYNVCRISSSIFGQNWPTLQRGLFAIAELLVMTSHYLWFDKKLHVSMCVCDSSDYRRRYLTLRACQEESIYTTGDEPRESQPWTAFWYGWQLLTTYCWFLCIFEAVVTVCYVLYNWYVDIILYKFSICLSILSATML